MPELPGHLRRGEASLLVRVEARDERGELRVHEVEDFLARAFLHEMDHLDGKLFIDYLSPIKRGMIRTKMRKRAAAAR